jgi:hypothetical protein
MPEDLSMSDQLRALIASDLWASTTRGMPIWFSIQYAHRLLLDVADHLEDLEAENSDLRQEVKENC